MHIKFPYDSLSVVVTAYNEEDCLETFIQHLMKFLKAEVKLFEVIVVNDGSTDTTAAVMDQLAHQFSQLFCVHLEKNAGMGAALKAGFDKAQMQWLTFFPADGQIMPVELKKFFQAIASQNLDCVASFYENRQYNFKRKCISFVFHTLTKIILGRNPRNEGIYVLKKSLYESLNLYSNTFLFNLELPINVQNSGAAFDSIPILLSPRMAGVSKAMQKPRIISTLWQMLMIRKRKI